MCKQDNIYLLQLRIWRKIKRTLAFPVFPIFSFWIAGRTCESAMQEAKNVIKRGGKCLINYLGEHYKDPLFVEEAISEYRKLIFAISKEKKSDPNFSASISIKPSQFGFDVIGLSEAEREKMAFENMREIVKEARKRGIDAEIDMEHSVYTDFTIESYKKFLQEFHDGIKLCLQANLKRTKIDLFSLIEFSKEHGVKVAVRLVKGVYHEKQNLDAFHSEQEIIENFKQLIKIALENSQYFDISVGTHRADIFRESDRLSRQTGAKYEAQMLKGIAFKLKRERYKNQHNPLRVYIPYGEDSIEYGLRRAKRFLKLLFLGNFHWFGIGK